MVYNAAGWVSDVDHLKSDNSIIQTFDYTFDNVGNRRSRVDADGNRVTWTYDATYQLTEEHRTGTNGFQTTFTYDPTGNRLTEEADGALTTSTYNAANQLLVTQDSLGDRTTYAYDDAGNQRTKEEPSGDLTTNTWNVENELIQAELPTGTLVTYTYNSDLLRVSREADLDNAGYIWDKKNLLHETDEFGDPQLDYHYEQQEYGNLISRREDTETTYYHFDALGSTDALTDSIEVVTDEYTYTAFGKELPGTGSTENPFRWVGQKGYQLDSATGNRTLRRRE
jgi:YD repeat-containing protein